MQKVTLSLKTFLFCRSHIWHLTLYNDLFPYKQATRKHLWWRRADKRLWVRGLCCDWLVRTQARAHASKVQEWISSRVVNCNSAAAAAAAAAASLITIAPRHIPTATTPSSRRPCVLCGSDVCRIVMHDRYVLHFDLHGGRWHHQSSDQRDWDKISVALRSGSFCLAEPAANTTPVGDSSETAPELAAKLVLHEQALSRQSETHRWLQRRTDRDAADLGSSSSSMRRR